MEPAIHRMRASSCFKSSRRLMMKARRLLKEGNNLANRTNAGGDTMRARNRQHQSSGITKRRAQSKSTTAANGHQPHESIATLKNNNNNNSRSRQISQINKINASNCICSGCDRQINDRFLLSACDKYWHESCLKCDRCQAKLGELGLSLYNKSNMNLCRQDYLEMFGQTAICSVCEKLIYASEMVMRAKQNVYHLECFACQLCGQRFCVGDRFYLFENKIVCQFDYEEHILPIQRSLLESSHKQLDQAPHIDTQSSLIGPAIDSTVSSDLIKLAEPLVPSVSKDNIDYLNHGVTIALETTGDIPPAPPQTVSPDLMSLEPRPAPSKTEASSSNARCLGSQIIDELGNSVRQQQSEQSLLICSHEGPPVKRNADNWTRPQDGQEPLIDVVVSGSARSRTDGQDNNRPTIGLDESQHHEEKASDCAKHIEVP